MQLTKRMILIPKNGKKFCEWVSQREEVVLQAISEELGELTRLWGGTALHVTKAGGGMDRQYWELLGCFKKVLLMSDRQPEEGLPRNFSHRPSGTNFPESSFELISAGRIFKGIECGGIFPILATYARWLKPEGVLLIAGEEDVIDRAVRNARLLIF
jgi:hypothetical protein